MNDGTKSFLVFVTGAAAGAVVAWKILEKKYKQMANEEIESVREFYNNKMKKKAEQEKKVEKPKREAEPYANVLETLGYKKESNKEETRDMAENAKVYVIPPEAFGEADFETVSLTYYADRILVDDAHNKVIRNVNEVVGLNSLETFGEYEDDSVFVRNENMKTDFEILLDMRNYSDVSTKKPHLVDDDDEN